MCLNYFLVKDRLATRPKKEATSCSVHLSRDLFQVVNRIVTKSFRFVSGILRVRFLELIHAPI